MYDHYNKLINDGYILIRVTSHRCRDRLERALGYRPDSYFSFYQDGEFRAVPVADADKALSVKGVTRARKVKNLHKCWS